MIPQESELVDELFNRLVQLETAQRDPEAERLIADGGHAARSACRLRCCWWHESTVLPKDERRSSAPMHASRNCRCKQAPRRSRNGGRQVSSTACGRLSAAARRTARCRAYARRAPISRRASSRSRDIRGKCRSPDIRVLPASARADRFSAPQPQPPPASSAAHCCLTASAQCSAITLAEPVRVNSPVVTISPQPMPTENKTVNRIWRDDDREQDRQQDLADEELLNKTPNKISGRRRRSTRQRARPDGRRGFCRRRRLADASRASGDCSIKILLHTRNWRALKSSRPGGIGRTAAQSGSSPSLPA